MFVEDIVPIPLSFLCGSMPQPPSKSFEEDATLSPAISQLSAFSSTQARRFVVQAISMSWSPACKCRRKSLLCTSVARCRWKIQPKDMRNRLESRLQSVDQSLSQACGVWLSSGQGNGRGEEGSTQLPSGSRWEYRGNVSLFKEYKLYKSAPCLSHGN